MKNIKLKFENLEIYMYFISAVIIAVIVFYFYGFLMKNVYNPIAKNEVILNPSSIRIVDVNVDKFEEVAEKIEQKKSNENFNSRNLFR